MRIARKVRNLSPYVYGEQPKARGVIKLNTNENPYPPTPKCATILKEFDLDKLRRYPDPVFTELRKALAKLNNTKPENIFVGNGSDDILNFAFMAFGENGVIFPDISYGFYKVFGDLYNIKYFKSFLQHFFPTLLDVVGNLGGEDVANLLLIVTEGHITLEHFLA